MYLLDTIRAKVGDFRALTREGYLIDTMGVPGDKVVLRKRRGRVRNTHLGERFMKKARRR